MKALFNCPLWFRSRHFRTGDQSGLIRKLPTRRVIYISGNSLKPARRHPVQHNANELATDTMNRRYKDVKSRGLIDMEFPFQVEMPESELKGDRIMDMQRFCAMFEYMRRLERRKPEFFVRWCFRERDQADNFCNTFGGTRIDLPDDLRKLDTFAGKR